MTRRAGQVTAPKALGGTALIAVCVAALVAGAHALVPAGTAEAELPGPAEDEETCPQPEDLRDPAQTGASQLIECPTVYDGRRVDYTGEAVVAVLRRGTRAWLQLNDDPYALDIGPLPEHRTAVGGNSGVPVSVPIAAADRIDLVGRYEARGDVLRVVGTFRRADPNDGGGPAIQADTVETVEPGRRIDHGFSPLRAVVAGAMTAVALAVTVARRRSQRA